jgi:hypothetical protein
MTMDELRAKLLIARPNEQEWEDELFTTYPRECAGRGVVK